MITSKKASSLAIVAFTFIVISLFAITLFSFAVKERNVNTELSNSFAVSEAYGREKIMELYVQDILDRATNESSTQEELNNNLKKQLNYYKNSDGEFAFPYFNNLEQQFDDKAKFLGNEARLENIEIRVKVEFYNKGAKALIVESYSVKNFTSLKT